MRPADMISGGGEWLKMILECVVWHAPTGNMGPGKETRPQASLPLEAVNILTQRKDTSARENPGVGAEIIVGAFFSLSLISRTPNGHLARSVPFHTLFAINDFVDAHEWKHAVVLFGKLGQVGHDSGCLELLRKWPITLTTQAMTHGAMRLVFVPSSIEGPGSGAILLCVHDRGRREGGNGDRECCDGCRTHDVLPAETGETRISQPNSIGVFDATRHLHEDKKGTPQANTRGDHFA